MTRFGQYIDLTRPAPPAPEPSPAPATATRVAPTAVQIAAPVAQRLRAFADRAKSDGEIAGLRFGAEVIDRGLRAILERLRQELEVGEEFPPPPKPRAPRRPYGGALQDDVELTQVTVKFDPALLAQARAALWYLQDHSVPPSRVFGIASLQELVTVAVQRQLDELGQPAV